MLLDSVISYHVEVFCVMLDEARSDYIQQMILHYILGLLGYIAH